MHGVISEAKFHPCTGTEAYTILRCFFSTDELLVLSLRDLLNGIPLRLRWETSQLSQPCVWVLRPVTGAHCWPCNSRLLSRTYWKGGLHPAPPGEVFMICSAALAISAQMCIGPCFCTFHE